jgi:mono/diheme cytochrome c family protein
VRRAAILLALPALALAGCGSAGDDRRTVTLSDTDVIQPTAPEPVPTHPQATSVSAKFLETCGACHTLKAAKANGVVGPNLDRVRPSARKVRLWISRGSVDGIMPAGLFKGREATQVAAYVARVAGR